VATELQVRVAGPDDHAGLLRLAAECQRGKEVGTEAYLSWLAGGTPEGPPIVVVAENRVSHEIVGFSWNLPLAVRLRHQPGRCYMSLNGLVHPDYRRTAIYTQMLDLDCRLSQQDGTFVYGWAKPVALFRVQSVGFRSVARVPLVVRPLRIRALVQPRLKKWWKRLGAQVGWGLASVSVFRPRPTLAGRWGLQVAEAPGFDASFDRLWDRVAGQYEVAVDRDRSFLTWRFTAPTFRGYQILTARAGGDLVAYAVIRSTEIEGVPTGMIADLVVEPTARGEAGGVLVVNEATRRFQADGRALAGTLMLSHCREFRVLRRAGYLECPEQFAPQPFRLMATPFTDGPTPAADRWFVTIADHDAI
jgi:hypothetical protein